MNMNYKFRTILVSYAIFITDHTEKGVAALDWPALTWLQCCAVAGFQDKFGNIAEYQSGKTVKSSALPNQKKCWKKFLLS